MADTKLIQQRIYQLPEDAAERSAWLEWFGGIPALRAKFGFRVLVATLDEGTNIFTWLVENDDFLANEQIMLASPERAEHFAKPRPAITILSTNFVTRFI